MIIYSFEFFNVIDDPQSLHKCKITKQCMTQINKKLNTSHEIRYNQRGKKENKQQKKKL